MNVIQIGLVVVLAMITWEALDHSWLGLVAAILAGLLAYNIIEVIAIMVLVPLPRV